MKRPLAFLLLIIALAWLLHWNDISLTGALSVGEKVCNNGLCEVGEDNNGCPEDCPNPICGNDVVEEDEECDGIDDGLCPDLCRTNCKCPPLEQRDINTLPYTYTFAYDQFKPNEVSTINLGRPKVDIMGVSLVASQTIDNPKFIIISNTSAPPEIPDGNVHSYFKLQISNLSQEQYFAYVEIFFRVPTSWTIEHNIKTVQLERADAVWQIMKTEKLYQDLDYIYFSAKSEKLGLFATVAPLIVVPEAICGNSKIESGETPETCCMDAGCPEDQSCISNKCIFVEVCGNNVCEVKETVATCPQDCATARYKTSAAPAVVILTAALVAVFLFLNRKLKLLSPKRPILRSHATPERWS